MTHKDAWLLHRRVRFDLAMSGGASFAGVDEVGRGCLAGPVVTAAVVLPDDVSDWSEVDDSKRLSLAKRERLFETIVNQAKSVAIGEASAEEIDEWNILRATQRAMGRALDKLTTPIAVALVDGNVAAWTRRAASIPVVRGDRRSLAIAAASIVAKVHRDRYMLALHESFPMFHFDTNVGYGTKEHLVALEQYGPSEYHRLSFAPVAHVRTRQVRLFADG